MYGIDLLIEEHEKILRFTDFLRKLCCDILSGQEVDLEKFREAVEFGRNYADKHHHGKEEKILFRYMTEELGMTAEKLIRNGMLVEHDLGRYHVRELVKALDAYEQEKTTEGKLDIITHATGYAELLKRHIEKENAVVFTFAERMLSDATKAKIDEETESFEREAKCVL